MPYRPFIDTLREIRSGDAHEELGRELNRLVDAVQATGKSGELILTVKVGRLKNAAPHVMQVSDEIKVKLPKPDRDVSLFFADDDNNLNRSDTRQYRLPLEAVSTNEEDRHAG